MSPVFPALLCLGLHLAQSTREQKGDLPPPRITALPGAVVPWRTNVALLCQGPPDADAYSIAQVGSGPKGGRPEAVSSHIWHIPVMTPGHARLYECTYQAGGRWSRPSAPLQLAISGAYNRPSLSSPAGTVLASGEDANLQCSSSLKFEIFVLTKEDSVCTTQNRSASPQGSGRQATFLILRAGPTQAGVYRCYGAFRSSPYVWSHPSRPLELAVQEPAAYLPSAECQVQLGLAGLVLLVLLVVMAESWHSWKMLSQGLPQAPPVRRHRRGPSTDS